MPEKKDPAGIIPDWFNRDMDFDGDCDLLDMTLYEDQFREEEEETPSYLEDEEDELEDDDALMERLSEMDETEREFFLMDHPTIQQRIEDDFELEEFMSKLDTESENDDFSNEDDDFYDEDEEFDDEDDDASDEFEDDLYTGKNAWREKYRENPITWLVDPVDYDDEQEYLEASQERKYAWRKGLSNPFGILPENFETRTDYEAALSEAYRKEREEREEKRRRMMHVEDTTLYKFCKISTNYPRKPHYYHVTGDLNVKVGDLVAVPLGYKNAETLGVVVSVGQSYSFSFPCTLDQMKAVIRIEETSPHGADETVEKKQHDNNAAESKSSPLEKVDPAICLRKIYDIVDRAGKRAKADFRSIAGLWVGALIKYAIDRTSILRRKKLEVFDSCMSALEYDGVVNGMAVYSEHPPEEIQVIVGSLDNIAVGFPKIIFAYSDNDDKRLFTTRVVSLLQWLEAYVVKNFNATESNLASSHYLNEMRDLAGF